ncbi:putative ORFan [Tupanvirus deep ocean]|uniref:ORFan n=2 Tax=Tupanvirus TaxID=2094720 RepID=A0AC62A7C8_9VIRU|nr:putative ORFan [Tupanvirus deep ocean]QKU33552.1 putative ORFan [Tupanvirus deep ocean]
MVGIIIIMSEQLSISPEVQKVFAEKYFLDDIGLTIINEHFKRENITPTIIDDALCLKYNRDASIIKLDNHRIIKRLVQLYSTQNENRKFYPEYLNLVKKTQTVTKNNNN